MNSDTNSYRLEFGFSVALLLEDALHCGARSNGGYGIIKARHDRVANRFHDHAALTFNDWEQEVVVAIEHRHVFDIAFFFGVCGGSLDVAEENRDRRSKLLQFEFCLCPRF